MTRRPKDIGTAAETAVVRFLRSAGFPHAERRALAGALDLGDITGTPGVAWEVKGGERAKSASDRQVAAWLEETEVERVNAGADFGVLVVQRRGIGAPNAGRWWAVMPLRHAVMLAAGARAEWAAPVRMHLADAALLLRAFGYGTEIEK